MEGCTTIELPEEEIMEGSGCHCWFTITGVKDKAVEVKAGFMLTPQLKIKPLSEARLSVMEIHQSPFSSQPSKLDKGCSEE